MLSGCYVGNPAYNGNIDFDGELTAENETFVMEGDVVNSGIENITFDEVRIYLYDENRSRIDAIDVGALSGSAPVSYRSSEIPEYVIISSPDFWNTSKVEVDYHERSDSGFYREVIVTSRNELPVQPG